MTTHHSPASNIVSVATPAPPAVAPAPSPASFPSSQASSRSTPSLHVKKSYTYYLEGLLDLSFLSSVLVAPIAVGLLGYWLWLGWWLWAVLALIVAVGASVVFYGRYIAPWQLQETKLILHDSRLEVSSPTEHTPPTATDGTKLRVVFFSDLHLARIKKRAWVQRVVDAANRHQPDVVLIGGDFVGVLGDHTFEDLLAPLKELHAPLGIYAILGNHDYGLPGLDHAQEIERALHSVGAQLLRNDALNLNARVQLITVDELWGDLDDIDKAFAIADAGATHSGSPGAGRQAQLRRIFLGHNPDLMLKMKPEQRADLFIFGHTHHGQIYLPFWPSLAVPIHSHFYRGAFETAYGPVYVSSGAGDANSPIRILTWPEIVFFDI